MGEEVLVTDLATGLRVARIKGVRGLGLHKTKHLELD